MSETSFQPKLPCGSESWGAYCAKLPRSMVCCDALSGQRAPRFRSFSFPGEHGLVDVHEVKDHFLKQGTLRFQNKTSCMEPTLRPGDWVQIVPIHFGHLQSGDMIVFKHDEALHAHRFVGIEKHKGTDWLQVFSDSSGLVSASKIPASWLVGKVQRIERRRRVLKPNRVRHGFFSRLDLQGRQKARRIFVKSVDFLQGWFLYKGIMRLIYFRKERKISLLRPTRIGVSGRFFVASKWPSEASPLKYQRFHFVAMLGNQKAGYISLLQRPANCPHGGWWIEHLFVRRRFRRLGIGSFLLRQAKALFPPNIQIKLGGSAEQKRVQKKMFSILAP